MNELNQRQVFDDFLDRLISDKTNPDEWQTLLANHYSNEVLEEIRRQLVRLSIQSPNSLNWLEEKTQLLACIAELRH